MLARLFEDRGLVLDRTYQLNVGGNMDFKNMLERERLESKKISKTQAVTSQLDNGIAADDVHIGPSDHVPWLDDRKWAYIRLEGRNFGDVPLNIELKLEVWDSPNSAGVIIDAIRCAKLALDRGIGGPLVGPSAYFMKSPAVQYHDDIAHQMVEDFAAGLSAGAPGPSHSLFWSSRRRSRLLYVVADFSRTTRAGSSEIVPPVVDAYRPARLLEPVAPVVVVLLVVDGSNARCTHRPRRPTCI